MGKESRRASRRNRPPRSERASLVAGPGSTATVTRYLEERLQRGELRCDRCGAMIGRGEGSRSVEVPTEQGPELIVACEACIPHLEALMAEIAKEVRGTSWGLPAGW